jgi:hypothetical protein
MSEENTIQIDDTVYDIDEMSDRARHLIGQIRHCTRTTAKLQAKIERSEVARVGFVNVLKEELNHPEPEEKSDDGE